MSLGQIKDYTPNFNLIIPRFDIATWHDYMESNFRSIDALFFNMFGINQYRGEWQNSTTYQIGDVLFIGDPDSQYTGRLVKVLVAHTTTANDSFDVYYAHNPINYDMFMDAAAAEQAAKLARDWAIKTDGKVQGIDYSSKYYANLITPISSDIQNLSAISTDITNVSSISSNIVSVDNNSTNINTVASMKPDVDDVVAIKTDIEWIADNDSIVTNVSNNSNKITTVANNINSVNINATNIANINTNASNISSINTTVANISDINTTALNINDINTTANISNDISTVANIASDVTSVVNNATDISAVASNNTNISAVANNETNINAVNSNKTNIDLLATNMTDITDVAANMSTISAVNSNSTNINAVNSNKTNIDKVANDINRVNLVADDIASVHTVAVDISNVIDVADNKTNIDTVATNINSINTNATNINDIQITATYRNSILTTATNISNINTVAGIDTDISTVAGISSDVTAVSSNSSNINSVASDLTNINSIASDLTNINAVAADLTNINNASSYAAESKQWAIGDPTEPSGGSAKYWAEQAAQGQIQSDWNQIDNTQKDYIKNKPNYGSSLSYSSNSLQLLDQNGNNLGSAVTIQSSPDLDNKSITKNSLQELQTVGIINQNNTSTAIKTWIGTLAQYNALNGLYRFYPVDYVGDQSVYLNEINPKVGDFIYDANRNLLGTVSLTRTSHGDYYIQSEAFRGDYRIYSNEYALNSLIDDNTLYWLTDGNKIYKGTTLIADNTVVDQTYNSTSTNAQSGIAVASAISGKANDSAVVHLAGNETISGAKTFSSVAYGTASDVNGSIVTTVSKTKNENGYFKLGNGMIVQWGYISFSSKQATITFPTSFSGGNTYRFVALRRAGSTTTNDGGQIFARSRTATTINIYASSDATGSCDWIAIGY